MNCWGGGGDEGVEGMQGVRVEDREEVIFSERLNICLCLKVVTRFQSFVT